MVQNDFFRAFAFTVAKIRYFKFEAVLEDATAL